MAQLTEVSIDGEDNLKAGAHRVFGRSGTNKLISRY